MSLSSNHIINNATLDFHFSGNADGFSFQQEMRDWFDDFVKQIEAQLDALPVSETVVSIDRVELAVELNGGDWREQLSSKLNEQLKEKLQLIKAGHVAESNYSEQTVKQHFAPVFLHFLQFGYLPWQSATLTDQQWNERLEQLLVDADQTFVLHLKDVLLASQSSRERFIQIVPFQSAVELFNRYTASRSVVYQRLVHDLQLLMKVAVVHHFQYIKQVLYKAFLLNLSEGADPLITKQELAKSIHKKALLQPEVIDVISQLQFQSNRLINLQKELKEQKKPAHQKSEMRKHRLQQLLQEEQELLLQQEQLHHLNDESIYISNAGLVIVAAFIPAMFEKLGYASAQTISDQSKAVCVLQHLVTGHDKMQEYELVLPKILCGIPLSKPVNCTNFRVYKEQRREADELLASVIEYWSVLQNTSVEGLRQSFLQRNGKLTYNGKDWMLQVEQQPYDMLLQHLPWNISMIRLPWMNHLLKTEWVY